MELQGDNDILELLKHGWLLLLKQNVAIGRKRNHSVHNLLLPLLVPASGVVPTASPDSHALASSCSTCCSPNQSKNFALDRLSQTADSKPSVWMEVQQCYQ